MNQAAQWYSGNSSVTIEAGSGPLTLASGSLAMFAIDKDTGERLHLFSLTPGDSLLALAPPALGAWEIAAVALETSCVQPTVELREWERIFVLENWLAKMGEAMARFRPAGEIQWLDGGQSLILKARQRIAVEQGLTLVHLEVGAGLLLGARVEEGVTVALTPGLWLEAAGESEWKLPESGEADQLAATIELAAGVLFEALDAVKRDREAADRARFLARQELNRDVSSRALGEIARIGSQKASQGPERLSGDPLLDAVQLAAAALNVTARAARRTGRSVDAVREIAHASGLRTRTVVLGGDWWRNENGPLVAHRANGNPVALIPGKRGYEIVDPKAGTRERVTRTSAAALGVFAQMLYRSLPEDLSVRSVLQYALSGRRRDLRTMLLAGVAAAALAMAAPQGFAILIGQAIPDADTQMIREVGGGILAAALGSAVFLFAQAVAILRVQSSAFATIQTGVWDHLLKLSPSFFRGYTAGQLRIRADAVTRIHQLLTADALRSLFAGAASLITLILIFWYSAVIGMLALGSGLAIAANTWWAARGLFRVQDRWQGMEETLSSLVLQSINAVSKLRAAGAEDRAFAHWARNYSRMQKLALAAQEWKDRIRLFNLVLPSVATALAFLYLLQQSLALGAFLACTVAMTAFLTAMTSASDSIAGLVLVANKWQQVRTILDGKPEVDGSKTHPGRLRGAIGIENLTFRYRSDGPMILDGVTVRARPGECIALTGPSGSGKSTLLNLLLRFERPHSGAIYLDGRELSSLDITAVRRQIGVVTQDGRIMAGSLFDNIRGGGTYSMDDAWDAARAAGLAEDIEAMPMGMYTVVSEGGGNLSGGQRQRVLIARALVLKPTILIFDEATSALDNRTQAIVTESLNRLKATRILVAHRLSTIRHADRIYVIEKGKVVQEGTFQDLSGQPGLFSRLASRQKA